MVSKFSKPLVRHPFTKAMEQYERAIKNLKTARSEHVAQAQLIITAGNHLLMILHSNVIMGFFGLPKFGIELNCLISSD